MTVERTVKSLTLGISKVGLRIFVIDAKGVIRYKNVRGDDLDDAIATLLAEMGHEVEITHDEEEDSEGADSEP